MLMLVLKSSSFDLFFLHLSSDLNNYIFSKYNNERIMLCTLMWNMVMYVILQNDKYNTLQTSRYISDKSVERVMEMGDCNSYDSMVSDCESFNIDIPERKSKA